jgi:outer membrane receptor protein involved in Fe transport
MNCPFAKTLLGLFLFAEVFAPAHAQERAATDEPATQSDSQSDSTTTTTKPKDEPTFVAPEPVVVVTTASRGPAIGDPSAATTVINKAQIQTAPAQTPDQLLHDIPVIALPRNDSHSLHPTGQSISMRGLGRGRTLVLTDGVPLNDPFGGWIHWNKVPLNEIVRAEIVRGATSNLYGSLAMAGVIQYLTAPTYEKRLFAQVDGGNFNSYHGNFTTAGPLGENFSGGIYGDFYRTDGYPIVKDRGPVDKPAAFESNNGGLKLTWKPSPQLTAFMGANYYLEGRDSGTKKTNNDWWFGDGTTGVDYQTEGGSHWQFRLFGGAEQFSNNNSSINAARTIEVRTLHQDIPVHNVGGSVVWWYPFSANNLFALGFDSRFISADNKEKTYSSTTGLFTGSRSAGGSQELIGFFGEWHLTPVENLSLSAGLRYDYWWNFDAESVATTGVVTSFPNEGKGAINPRLGLIYRINPELSVRTAGYTGFRAPNLNELYRGFFSAGVQNNGNPALGPERVYGGEMGADWSPVKPLRFSVTGFYNLLTDLIQSVTVTPTLTQRENVGKAESYGVELESQYQPFANWTFTAAYALTISDVTQNNQNPALVGNWLPGVPRQQGVVSARWADPDWLDVTLRLRAEGYQFANDLNTFRLPGYATMDLFVSRELRELVNHLKVFVAVTNLFNKQIITGKNQTVTNIGAPLTVWGGLRTQF